jgi:hypothetical protein
VLYTIPFHGREGGLPSALVIANDGTLYCATYGTGTILGDAAGTIFQLAPPSSSGGDWTYGLIENFGYHLLNQPLLLRGGDLITGMQGGGPGPGPNAMVFAMTPPSNPGGAWDIKYLYLFTDDPIGFELSGNSFVMDGDGTIYGATAVNNYPEGWTGTVFRVAP